MQGRRTLHPALDYCHFCQHQGQVLAHRQEPNNGQCTHLEWSLSPQGWKGDLPVPFTLHVDITEERIRNHEHHVPQRRQVYMGPSHYAVPEICSPPCYLLREVRVPTWVPQMPPCNCVWQRPKECGWVGEWYHHKLPESFNNGPVLAKVKSQQFYKAQLVSEEHYWDCSSESDHQDSHLLEPERDNRHTRGYNGHCERKHVTFEGQDDLNRYNSKETNRSASPTKNCFNGSRAFFSTEVPQSKLGNSRTSGPKLTVNGVHQGRAKIVQTDRSNVCRSQENQINQRKSKGAVREQIKQVVTELEDVLSGLKQVQVEMKEVVQQIDILTSNIDLEKEDQEHVNGLPQDASPQSNRIGVVALVHNSNGDVEIPQTDSVRPGVKWWTNRSQSDHGLATVATDIHAGTTPQTNPSARVHGLVTAVSADSLNHTSATETYRTQSNGNGECLRARPPRDKVKDPQLQKNRADITTQSKTPEPPFPLVPVVMAKTQRPPPYPQNGQVKKPPQDSNDMKKPPYPGKQKQISSTIV
ncbi:uncharacterized protein si:ch211-178n15.1 [Trichomycterus rosablanca]|uniref:uncharacterized protein si:ch211-178n15.1 n=1 Tax=Trichomycterus rosablanca TaxID=2290929 RepID=UPI002F359875